MELKKTFNEVISDYDYARPCYPDQLYKDIINFAEVSTASNILEVGAGTGKSTDFFAAKGYNVVALEIGEHQIAFLKNKYRYYPNIKVVHSAFEDYNEDRFNLIFSGTTFHWIKPAARYTHSASLLNNNGTLALYWVTTLNREIDTDIHKGIQKICKENVQKTVFYPESFFTAVHQYRYNEINSCGEFNPLDYRVYHWGKKYSAKKYAALINTFEYIQILPSNQRNILLRKIENYINLKGGSLIVPHQVELYLMKKIPTGK